MDGKQFDSIARSLAGQTSRRVLAGGLVCGTLGVVLHQLPQPVVEARRKRNSQKDNDRVAAEKKRKKKKVTLCQSGQTIKVSQKAKKKRLSQGTTLGPCQDTPACVPNANPCSDRECGSVDNGCGVQVACGECTGPEICNNNNGVCGCTPTQNPCAGRVCGRVDNGCGTPVQCGECTSPATCNDATGQCVCTPSPNACAGRECGSADNGCGQRVACGPSDGACAGGDTCNAAGECLPASCQSCNGCCTAQGTCLAGSVRETCGHTGRRCKSCNPEVACVNGECTCSNGVSCGQGCCSTDQNGRPFCDNTKRPCGNTCIPKEACCTGVDSSNQQVREGCLPNETCALNQATGFGACRCGTGGQCQRNQGCCTVTAGQTTCDTSLRPCGDICIDKTQCCRDGQVGCDDGVTCTSETCQPATGTGQNPSPGICVQTFPNRICTEACAAGQGYGNATPENQREVICASSGSVAGLPCYCWRTTEGDNACTEDFYDAPMCRTSADCANGRVCIRSGLTTGSNRCAPICQ